ncbi:hypothetical protein BDZ97DRAFT_1839632 [Flammula alnicola]|nr:hypothetical protein BDZ97DRAFT_1839632 [Flammula alnicola]
MCRWRQIQDTYAHCNHSYRLEDEMVVVIFGIPLTSTDWILQVYCPDRWCKFSPYHLPDCGPNCRTTCCRQFPEQVSK